jgi:uncharacterized protein YjiS (DUF1127 family)
MNQYTKNPVDYKTRFWSKVTITNNINDCWLWTRACFSNGYGAFQLEGKQKRAHRMAWEIIYGSIPNGLCVCHKCDVRLCCNPLHLFLATSEENTQDKVSKGRQARNKGLKSGKSAKLNPSQVEEIRQRYALKELNQYELADVYGVKQQQISRIVNHKRWS